MSTLGGNRGERDKNAKPKFQKLDINKLYRNSRGETFEPATQKNTAPRKHGMQSLGKVPSARRPPANLPSLKAETSSPASAPIPTNEQQQQQTNNSSSASWVDSGASPPSAGAITASSQLNISGGSTNQTAGGGPSANTSWSAVATGANAKEENLSQPPLYQSSQFQNEFPSLDGSVTTSANASATGVKQQNPNSNSHDSGEQMNLRPSTDVASWLQQQQSNSGNARGGAGENGNYQQPDVVSTKIMSLMPSFMTRGSQGPVVSNSSVQSTQHQMNRDNIISGGGGGNYQNQGRSNRSYGGSSYNNDNYSNGPPRHQQRHPQPRRQHNDDRGSSYESEVIVQRPIIKEEELDRIDSLARDDGWSKHDEIDYNKKIHYSDDETDDIKPKDDDKKADAWRDNEKKQHNGPIVRQVDPLIAKKMRERQDEEERVERERKMNAQKKFQELEEKSKSKSSSFVDKEKESEEKLGDFEKKSDRDYGKKYGSADNKYGNTDSYDYGRGAPANDFKKSSFQSNLPPRFQKQQNFDRHEDRREKPGPPGYKTLHQQDSKNVPFAQQSYEPRWTYNKQPQQAPPARRNMSSLSQSSSDDNRRENSKGGYGRRRLESEEDDYRYAKEPVKKPVQAQITRSMSDSSDKLSDHNRSEKSTSREYLGTNVCWAEVCENDKQRPSDSKTRRVSESSAMSDDQPRTILQRNKPLHDQLKDVKKGIKESPDEQKSVLSESPPKSESIEKILDKSLDGSMEQKKSLESIPEKDQGTDKTDNSKDLSKASKEIDDNRHKKSPRSNRYERDTRSGPPTRGNYNNNYRGANNWQGRRGTGGNQRGGRYDYSDSENSDDYDQEWNRKGSGGTRKDLSRDGRPNYATGTKEGFSPRGEPSRRGRGGMSNTQSSGFRRSGSNGAITAPTKNYGPPSSKSPFGSNDEKSSSEKRDSVNKDKLSDDDRIKQKQKALSDGLMNKSQKESSNVATKASSPSAIITDEPTKHSIEPAVVGEQKDKKIAEGGDMSQRTSSSSSFNASHKKPVPAVVPAKIGSKPATVNPPTAGKPMTTPPPSHQYSSSSTSKPTMDPRHQMNRSDPRMDPRNVNNVNNNSRNAPRFTNKRENVPSGPPMNNRMTGSYWDKDQMHHDDKMSMMQMNAQSSGLQSNNLLNSKTDVMKQQQNQQQPPPSMQQQQNQSQPILDGSSLKTTLIFENTSFKTGPPAGIKRPPQGPPPMGQQQKPQENTINTINDMIDQQAKEQSLSSALQNMSFGQQKGQNDMEINFSYAFDSQIGGLLTDDRNKSGFGGNSNSNVHPSQKSSSSLGLVGAKTGMQNSNILNTDSLNMKVASCKKVWEEPSVSMDHSGSTNDDVMSNFGHVQHQHLHQYGQSMSGQQSYGSYGGNSSNDHNSSLEHFNKSNDNDDGSSYPSPGQQQHMVHSQNQQANMNMKAAEAAFATNANVCKVKPTQQQMHQAGLSPPPQIQQSQLQQQQTYYPTPNYPNMSAIPSPPVVYNSQATAAGIYNPYNLDASRQVYGYPTAGTVGANSSMAFNAFAMQTASAPAHEIYQNLNQYRATVQPFNQSNPNAAVLIGNANPSKSSSIGTIGSKSSQSAGPAAASGQYGQQYMSHLYHQHQNNNYYNSSAQQQANAYYNGPSATGQQASGNYGMFASHGTNVSNGPPPQPQQMANFGSVGQYSLGSQILNNMVMNPQYRSNQVVNSNNNGNGSSVGSNSNAPPGGYMKQQHQSQLQDPKLSSQSDNPTNKVYNNQNWDTSTASTNNFSSNRMYGNSQNSQSRWPTPIQRPTNSGSNGYNANSPSPQYVNYQQNYQNSHHQQRPMRSPMNPPINSGMHTMSQGKSQFFNQPPAGAKYKSDGEKVKSQASPSKGDPKIE